MDYTDEEIKKTIDCLIELKKLELKRVTLEVEVAKEQLSLMTVLEQYQQADT
tara:strand:- start:183 stop:338 length:156 start_codon:yes stop_codon:yes gene_type:complete